MEELGLTLTQQLRDDHRVLGLDERLGVAVGLEVVARVHRQAVREVARVVRQAPLADAHLRRTRHAHLREAVRRARRVRCETELLKRQHHHLCGTSAEDELRLC